MDLFTHVLVAYLISFGLAGAHPQYLAAGALAGGLPDADALFFPIARRFPLLQHHGITHSLLGVTIVAVAGGLLGPLVAAGTFGWYFLVMEVGGLAHIAQDGFTNFSVPPLLPFSKRRLELDADRAVNFVTLVVSVVAFYVLLVLERNQVPYAWYLDTLYLLTAFFVAYFALRLSARLYIGRHLRQWGEFQMPVPTSHPMRWILISESKSDGRFRTTYAHYVLGQGLVDGPHTVDVPQKAPRLDRPVATAQEALEQSYSMAHLRRRFLEDSYKFGRAEPTPQGGWIATWYSLEFGMFGRAAAVRVTFPADGSPPAVRSAWQRVPSRWRRAAGSSNA